MCGEDGTQKIVYRLKEEHVRKGLEQKRKKKVQTKEEERKKRQELY